MIFLGALSLAFSIALCFHVVRTGQQMYWIFIILAFQPVGGLVYLFVILGPDAAGGPTARRLTKAAQQKLDPDREYRQAREAHEDAPTVANIVRLAQAASATARYQEAEDLYREAAQGMHAEDVDLLVGRADALVELGRPNEALEILQRLGELGEKGRTSRAALLMARAYHDLGRFREADEAYAWASERLIGLEGLARYAAFLAEQGRMAEARELQADLNKRASKAGSHFRAEARYWRDFAANAVEGRAT